MLEERGSTIIPAVASSLETETPKISIVSHLDQGIHHEPRRGLLEVHEQRLEADAELVPLPPGVHVRRLRRPPRPAVGPREQALVFSHGGPDPGEEAGRAAACGAIVLVRGPFFGLEDDKRVGYHPDAEGAEAQEDHEDRVDDLEAPAAGAG